MIIIFYIKKDIFLEVKKKLMWIPFCIIYPAISPAFNPTAENYKEKITHVLFSLSSMTTFFVTTSNAVFVSTSNPFTLAFNYTISTTI